MDRRTIPLLGSVGAVGYGCMGLTGAYTAAADGAPEAGDGEAVVRRAVELGATLVDTAQVYGPYTGEELLGRALRGVREQVTLATKGGLRVVDAASWQLARDGSPAFLRRGLEQSLRRLGVDHVDLYYLHRPDPEVSIEESVGGLAELVTEGKTRAIGLSEVTAEQLARAVATHPIAALQSELSLWTRGPLDRLVGWCADHDIAFVPFSPLGRGFLTGRYRSASYDADDFRARNPRFQPEAVARNLAIVEAVERVADRHAATAGQVAIAWTLAQGPHVVPIPGTKRLGYLEENCAAADLRLSDEDLAELDALPAAAGDRY